MRFKELKKTKAELLQEGKNRQLIEEDFKRKE